MRRGAPGKARHARKKGERNIVVLDKLRLAIKTWPSTQCQNKLCQKNVESNI
jgi:hypothetical protein